MKRQQASAMPDHLSSQLAELGQALADSRIARKITQAEAAVRANVSRNTIVRIERGDAGVAVGQILRYLDAVRPGVSLQAFLSQPDTAVVQMEAQGKRQRSRPLGEKELKRYDF
ncbi:helix-turn-helix domain-containing protein [Pseudomonas indica]|jgi:transcriptional regulator with XRE-family HTH domain|uniref:helix-turn-helix domain-containing protein n=1 Tax=Pseudomonas indica TaxID=137658 RepID=UPI003FCF2D1A